jgi:hypothetical protein
MWLQVVGDGKVADWGTVAEGENKKMRSNHQLTA